MKTVTLYAVINPAGQCVRIEGSYSAAKQYKSEHAPLRSVIKKCWQYVDKFGRVVPGPCHLF